MMFVSGCSRIAKQLHGCDPRHADQLGARRGATALASSNVTSTLNLGGQMARRATSPTHGRAGTATSRVGFQRGWPPLLGKGRLEVRQKGSLGIASPSRRPRQHLWRQRALRRLWPRPIRFEHVTFAFGGQRCRLVGRTSRRLTGVSGLSAFTR
jgi:hypothetical protein